MDDLPAQSSRFEILSGQFREYVPQTLSQFRNHLFGDEPILSPRCKLSSRYRDFTASLTVEIAWSVDGYFDETFRVGREYVESVVEIEILLDQSVEGI